MFKFMKKDFKIVENFKWLALISLVVFVVGIAMGFYWHGLNIGIDYEGGAKIEIELDECVVKDEKQFEKDVKAEIEKTVNGKKRFLVADKMQKSPLNGGVSYEFRLRYYMDGAKINSNDENSQKLFTEALNGIMEDDTKNGLVGELKTFIAKNLNNADLEAENYVRAYTVGATASATLIRSTIIATIVAIAVILIYIIFRFTLSSGLAAIIALAHDVLFMVAFTSMFNIAINSTFIAAVITIIGYSINATIVIFDKIRECRKSTAFAYASDAEIANYAIKHSFVKIMLSTITTLIMVVALVIFSVSSIREFIYPIIFGLVGGTFSSLCLSPSIWVLFRKIGKKSTKQKKA